MVHWLDSLFAARWSRGAGGRFALPAHLTRSPPPVTYENIADLSDRLNVVLHELLNVGYCEYWEIRLHIKTAFCIFSVVNLWICTAKPLDTKFQQAGCLQYLQTLYSTVLTSLPTFLFPLFGRHFFLILS